MNSLVKDLCNKCENSICENYRRCAFRSLSNEYCDEVERLDLYINQLQQENQQLKEQLKQRDEVFDEAIDTINKMIYRGYIEETNCYWATGTNGEFYCRAEIIKKILSKYKGDSNGNK